MSVQEAKQTFVKPFFEGLTAPDNSWQRGYEVLTDDVPAMKLAGLSGVGAVPEWNGSDDVDQADVNDRYNTTVTYTKYALQVRLNKYDVRDVPRILPDAGRKLGVAIANTYASVAATLLEDSFDTVTAGDGVSLINDSHPAEFGVRDNALGSAFDRSAYMAAINLATLWTSYHGQEDAWSNEPMVLFGSPQDATFRTDAFETFASQVASSEMQANVAAGFVPDIVIWPKLTDATRWWVVSKTRSPLVFWVRAGAETETNVDVDNLGTKITTSFCLGVAAKPDPAGIVGSDT